jgi:hypothetical protein
MVGGLTESPQRHPALAVLDAREPEEALVEGGQHAGPEAVQDEAAQRSDHAHTMAGAILHLVSAEEALPVASRPVSHSR